MSTIHYSSCSLDWLSFALDVLLCLLIFLYPLPPLPFPLMPPHNLSGLMLLQGLTLWSLSFHFPSLESVLQLTNWPYLTGVQAMNLSQNGHDKNFSNLSKRPICLKHSTRLMHLDHDCEAILFRNIFNLIVIYTERRDMKRGTIMLIIRGNLCEQKALASDCSELCFQGFFSIFNPSRHQFVTDFLIWTLWHFYIVLG